MASDMYTIKCIKSSVEKGEVNSDLNSFIINKINEGFIICWLHYEVLFGKIENNGFTFYSNLTSNLKKYLIKLRAFNDKDEIYLWKHDDKLSFRYRKDGEGTDWEIIDAKQVMFGTNSRDLGNGFTEIKEKRGIKYIVPTEFLNGRSLSIKARLMLITRNYIYDNELGQANFIDSRFLKIIIRERE